MWAQITDIYKGKVRKSRNTLPLHAIAPQAGDVYKLDHARWGADAAIGRRGLRTDIRIQYT